MKNRKIKNFFKRLFKRKPHTPPCHLNSVEEHDFDFPIIIENTDPQAKTRTIALNPGYFTEAAQMTTRDNPVDAIIKDGVVIGIPGIDALKCSTFNKSISEFLACIKHYPVYFTSFKIQCNNMNQFGQVIHFKKLSPFHGMPDQIIIPDTYKRTMQEDKTRVEIPLSKNFCFNAKTQICITVVPDSKVVIYFYGGEYVTKELSPYIVYSEIWD